MRDEDNQPCTSTTAGPPPIMRKRIQTPSSSTYSVSRALSTSLASRPSTMEAARITATTTNETINVMPMEAMIAQKRANRIRERRALLVLPGVVGPLPTSTLRITNRCRRARPHVAWDVAFPGSADTIAPVVAVETFQLRAKECTVVETRVAVDAEEHLLRTARVQVVVQHEVEELPVLFADLIHELRERDAARDQTLARFVGVELSQTTVGVPHDEPRGDVSQTHSLLHHQDGPFLAPGGVFPRFPDTP